MTLTTIERTLLDKKASLSEIEQYLIDTAFSDMEFRANAAKIPLLGDDNAAKLEAAFVRYLLACKGTDMSIQEQGYPDLEIDKVLYKSHPMLERTKNERKVVYALLSQLVAAGFNIVDVDDGEDLTQITRGMGDQIKAAMEVLFNLDDCAMYVVKEGYKQHYIRFVFGNADDGSEVVADFGYTEGDPDGFQKLMDEFEPEKYV